jgi:hypothetical protein
VNAVMPHSRALWYHIGMADNPYQSPQTRSEVRLASAWRRHVSIWLITFGILASVALVSNLVGSALVLKNTGDGPLPAGEFADRLMAELWETVEVVLVCTVVGPGLLLSGLATRQLIRWRTAGIAMVVVLIPISAYVAWWWPYVKKDLTPTKQQHNAMRNLHGEGEI